jgi:hypothetical protein
MGRRRGGAVELGQSRPLADRQPELFSLRRFAYAAVDSAKQGDERLAFVRVEIL